MFPAINVIDLLPCVPVLPHTHLAPPRLVTFLSSHLISSHLVLFSVPAKFEERRERKSLQQRFCACGVSPGALGRPFNFKKEKLKVGNPGSVRSRLLPTTFLPFLNFTSATGRRGERLRFFFTTYLTFTYLVLGVCDDCVLKFLFLVGTLVCCRLLVLVLLVLLDYEVSR